LVAGLRTTYAHPDRDVVVAGDVNCEPTSASLDALESGGWVDAWASTPPDSRTGVGPTNWTPGPRAGRSPTQRIDQIFIPQHWICRRAAVPADHELYSTLSDHLPLLVEAERPIGVI
jgi:endonuclease/exonuclease/phosphatase family metal-dependent hydrolase